MSRRRVPGTFRLSFESVVHRPVDEVWRAVSSMDGVNAELAPWFRMTFPPGRGALRSDDPVVLGGFHSWLLLGGAVPIDRHSFGFESIVDGGFIEESSSWMNRRWRHERTVTSTGETSCAVRDELTIEPRLGALVPLSRLGVDAVFRHRHRRLSSLYQPSGV